MKSDSQKDRTLETLIQKGLPALLPTPTMRDYKDTGNMENTKEHHLLGRTLGKRAGLRLQPAFVEWMMGFPVGWTDTERTA